MTSKADATPIKSPMKGAGGGGSIDATITTTGGFGAAVANSNGSAAVISPRNSAAAV